MATTFRACGGVGIYLQVPVEVLADCGYYIQSLWWCWSLSPSTCEVLADCGYIYYIQSLWKCCALFAGTCGTFFYLRVPLTVQELTSNACECAAGT